MASRFSRTSERTDRSPSQGRPFFPCTGSLKATTPAATKNLQVPLGWMAVDIPGPHEVYVPEQGYHEVP